MQTEKELQSGGEVKELADTADKLSKRLVKDTTAWTNKKEKLTKLPASRHAAEQHPVLPIPVCNVKGLPDFCGIPKQLLASCISLPAHDCIITMLSLFSRLNHEASGDRNAHVEVAGMYAYEWHNSYLCPSPHSIIVRCNHICT